jgi:hypothetical protein
LMFAFVNVEFLRDRTDFLLLAESSCLHTHRDLAFTVALFSFSFFLFFFFQCWGFEIRVPHTCYTGTLPLKTHPHPFFSLVIFQVGSC